MGEALVTLGRGERFSSDVDWFGVRPIFVANAGGRVCVSRSLVRLREDAGVTGVDPGRARDALLGDVTRPVLADVHVIPRRASLSFDGRTAAINGPDPLPCEAPASGGPRLRTKMLDRLGDAIERQVAGRTAAALLTGGLVDAALLALAPPEGLKAWSLANGVGDEGVFEAAELAGSFGVPHRIFEVAPDDLPAAFERAVRATEAPISSDLDVARFLLYREMAFEGARVVLVSDGGPELLYAETAGLRDPNGAAPPCLVEGSRLEAVARLLLADQWAPAPAAPPGAMDAAAARDAALEIVLPRRLALVGRPVPPGTEVAAPFLDPAFVGFARGLPESELAGHPGRGSDGAPGMRLLRQALDGELSGEVLSGPSSVPMRLETVRLPAVKKKWTQVYNGLVRPARLHDVGIFDMEKVLKLFRRYDKTDPADPSLPLLDATLKRLASISVLAEVFRA